ncbi:lipoyl(octanoyl) transferase LipB [Arenimonas sp.]|uniref:lipoyl(octanoyl) transferase LipB n=1 Tax=Arenimonas sp. TaxID=1872635 RepID=UPI0037C07F73
MDAITPSWQIRRLGIQPYSPVWDAQERHTAERGDNDGRDELWLLQHMPVYTLGQTGKPEHVLLPGAIPIIRCNRGGQVTYHGPGQIVAYPLVNIRRLGIGVRELVTRIEQALIDTLAHWDIVAERRSGAPGVYVGAAKIAALGLRVKHGCSLHGLAFNIAMDLAPFHGINPCGYAGLEVTQMVELNPAAGLDQVEPILVAQLSQQLGLTPVWTDALPPAFLPET